MSSSSVSGLELNSEKKILLTRIFCPFKVQYMCVYMTHISDSICAADITLERHNVKKFDLACCSSSSPMDSINTMF